MFIVTTIATAYFTAFFEKIFEDSAILAKFGINLLKCLPFSSKSFRRSTPEISMPSHFAF